MSKVKSRIRRLLIWSQKYTKTDNIYLAKGGLWLISSQVISMAASFLLAIAFANLLEPIIYGYYKYILSLVQILGIFSLGGINTAVTQAVARGLEGSFYSGFKTKLKWGVLGSLAAIGIGIYYLVWGNAILSIPLLISAIFLPLMQASRIYGNFLGGKKLFKIAAKYSIISQIIFVVATVFTLFLTKNLFWLIAVYFVSNTFSNYFFYLLTKSKLQPNQKEESKTLSYGKHLSFMNIISKTSKYLDKILLFTLIGPAELAVYSFAILIPDQNRNILSNVHTLAFPKLAVKSREEIRKNLMKKVWKFLCLIGVIITLYIVIAPSIYKMLFPKYITSIPYSQLFIFSLVSTPTSLLTTVFRAKMMKKQLYLSKIASVARLIFLVVLIPTFGILGAILAMVGAQIFMVATIFLLFHFSFRKKPLKPI